MKTEGHSNTSRRYLVSFLLLFPFLAASFGQGVKIRIKAPETVLTGEQFKVDYIIESESAVEEPIIIKNMEGFAILYGPTLSTSKNVSFNKGKRITAYISTSSYYLQAEKEGKYDLPRVEVTVNGKKYKPDSFRIQVKSTDDITGNIEAFVKTTISKTSVNLNDTLLLTYKLYSTKEINRIKDVYFPSSRDFYSTNVTRPRQQFSEEEVDGQSYKVAELRVLILQPRSEGRFVIPEGQITVEYATPTGRKRQNMWGETYEEMLTTDKTLKMDSVAIGVHNMKEV